MNVLRNIVMIFLLLLIKYELSKSFLDVLLLEEILCNLDPVISFPESERFYVEIYGSIWLMILYYEK